MTIPVKDDEGNPRPVDDLWTNQEERRFGRKIEEAEFAISKSDFMRLLRGEMLTFGHLRRTLTLRDGPFVILDEDAPVTRLTAPKPTEFVKVDDTPKVFMDLEPFITTGKDADDPTLRERIQIALKSFVDGVYKLVGRGGPGSGHHGHEGRPGEVGGSLPSQATSSEMRRASKAGFNKIRKRGANPLWLKWEEIHRTSDTNRAYLTKLGDEAFQVQIKHHTSFQEGSVIAEENFSDIDSALDWANEHLSSKVLKEEVPEYETRKLTKTALNDYLQWTSSRYNEYKKGEVVDIAHKMMLGNYWVRVSSLENKDMLREIAGSDTIETREADGGFEVKVKQWVVGAGVYAETGPSTGIVYHINAEDGYIAAGYGGDTPDDFRHEYERVYFQTKPTERGGPGSGHHGHKGREGEVGGSEPGEGGGDISKEAREAAGRYKRAGRGWRIQRKAVLDLATEDFQNRGDDSPASNVPESIEVINTMSDIPGYKDRQGVLKVEVWFKSTEEDVAREWLEKELSGELKKKYSVTPSVMGTEQRGDYHNDWVVAYADFMSLYDPDEAARPIFKAVVSGPLRRISIIEKGGAGSGHHGHEGREGKVGGSQPGAGAKKGKVSAGAKKGKVSTSAKQKIKKNIFDPEAGRLPDRRDEDIQNTIDRLAEFELEELREMQDELREMNTANDPEHFQMLDRVLAAAVDKREFGDEEGPEMTPEEEAEEIEATEEYERISQAEPDIQTAADTKVEAATAIEPELTTMVTGLAEQFEGESVGLEYAVKSEDSLARKIRTDMIEKGISAQEAADAISDVNRYTILFDRENYVEDVLAVQQELADQGWEQYDHKWKNYFRAGDAYDGYNTVMINPETGQRFELQYHTPESMEIKANVHKWYEELRIMPDDQTSEAKQLQTQMRESWADYQKPEGWERLPGVLK